MKGLPTLIIIQGGGGGKKVFFKKISDLEYKINTYIQNLEEISNK